MYSRILVKYILVNLCGQSVQPQCLLSRCSCVGLEYSVGLSYPDWILTIKGLGLIHNIMELKQVVLMAGSPLMCWQQCEVSAWKGSSGEGKILGISQLRWTSRMRLNCHCNIYEKNLKYNGSIFFHTLCWQWVRLWGYQRLESINAFFSSSKYFVNKKVQTHSIL